MTSRDILIKFNHRFGSLHDLDANVLQTDEITEAFNISMLQLLSEYVKAYESNELIRVALQPLVKTHSCVVDASPTNAVINTDSKVYTIPSDCFAVVLAHAGLTHDETPIVLDEFGDPIPPTEPDSIVLAKPVTHDQYWKNIENPFKQPFRKLAWRLNYIDGHEVIPDSTSSIFNYTIRYIKTPVLLDIINNSTVELNTKEIDIIIDLAVAKAFEFLVNNGRVTGTLSVPSQKTER